jgi:hypothetical protein
VNAGDGDTEFTVEFRPAQEHLRFFSNFARLTAEHPEWFSEKGDPDFLLIAASLDRFRNHTYLARPPVFLQKFLFATIAPFARLVGYRFELKPVHGWWDPVQISRAGASCCNGGEAKLLTIGPCAK